MSSRPFPGPAFTAAAAAQCDSKRRDAPSRHPGLEPGSAFLHLVALPVIGAVAVLVWKVIEIDECYDAGGIVVAPLMRDQQCYMPKTADDPPSSRP